MIPTAIDSPELASIALSLPASGISFPNFLSYELGTHYLVPCSGFWFELDEDELSFSEKSALVPGAAIQATVCDLPQVCGYIDTVDVRSSRSGGTIWHMECREWNSPILDAHADPEMQFSETQTLAQLIQTALSSFVAFNGGAIQLVTDASANRNVITGASRGTKTNKNGTLVKSALAHRVKPYQHEGVWAFLERVCQRFGLWLRPSADGTTIIASQPDFTQDPSYGLVHVLAQPSNSNVVDGGIKLSRMNQPTAILASGFGGGGVFVNSTLRAAILNPVMSVTGAIVSLIKSYPGISIVETPDLGAAPIAVGIGFSDTNARPLYLYDSESHNLAELTSFLKRELSLKMREGLRGSYSIEGHRLGGQPVAVDTVVQVDDDRSNYSGPLWVQDRTFSKQQGQGTKTKMTLIRLGTLSFA